MNVFTGSGRLINHATIRTGKPHGVEFVLEAKHGFDCKACKTLVEAIPCVLMDPSDRLQGMLTGQGKGLVVEFQGRLTTSRISRKGETHNRTEILVDKTSFNIITRHNTPEEREVAAKRRAI